MLLCLIKFSQLIFKELYGDQSEEIACEYWVIKG